LHARELPGCPDLVFPRDRKLVFVHGCFWHQHARCKVARMPKSRASYWKPKLEGNKRRDLRNARRLKRAGWSVLTIRECDLRHIDRVAVRLEEFLLEAPSTHSGASMRSRTLAGA
jgi:DNA mismatch endonuclease (patch repair protein)